MKTPVVGTVSSAVDLLSLLDKDMAVFSLSGPEGGFVHGTLQTYLWSLDLSTVELVRGCSLQSRIIWSFGGGDSRGKAGPSVFG